MRRLWLVLLAIALIAIMVPTARAQTFLLTDDNSSVNIANVYGNGPEAYTWYVDHTNNLYEQGFWLRVGSETQETSLGAYYTGATQVLPNVVKLSFSHVFDISVTYTLIGGGPGSGTADIGEAIAIKNNSGHAAGLHFFQYSDFDLYNHTPGGDELMFTNDNTVQQWGDVPNPRVLTETVATPAPAHHEGAAYSTLLSSLNDNAVTTLNDTPAVGTTMGPGDMTWAYQWDHAMAPGGSFTISKDKNLSSVPEPGTMLLLGFGLLGAEITRRRRKRG